MGTFFTLKIADATQTDRATEDVARAKEILDDADERFSLYKEQSEISRIARGELDWTEASKVQLEVRSSAMEWKNQTDSYFNPTSPSGVYDPSGYVKTWAATNAAIYLEANGYRDFTINAGGDIYLGPEVTTFPLNRVGLSNLKPISSEDSSTNMVLDLLGTGLRAVATSGTTERGEHIWRDERAGSSFMQVTVAAKNLITADIWATAIMAGGDKALWLFEERCSDTGATAIATYSDGRMSATKGFVSLLASL